LKQARQRASRRFLNDGARSSLPQYRQTSFSALDASLDDRRDARATLLVFERAPTFGWRRCLSFLKALQVSPR